MSYKENPLPGYDLVSLVGDASAAAIAKSLAYEPPFLQTNDPEVMRREAINDGEVYEAVSRALLVRNNKEQT